MTGLGGRWLQSDICKSKPYRINAYTDQVTEVCQSMIGTEEIKRKIVAQFLSKDLSAKMLPGRKVRLTLCRALSKYYCC